MTAALPGTTILSMTSTRPLNRSELRRQLRSSRNSLTDQQQRHAAGGLMKTLSKELFFRRAKRIALYLPNDGEISPLPLLTLSEKLGKQCYLPVLHPHRQRQLLFGEYSNGDKLVHNRFNIPEPDLKRRKHCQNHALDVVLMPLVGFDSRGNRLGMGGGFYDRSFAFKQKNGNFQRKPLLIGLAHSLQEVDALPVEPWDVPLFGVATEKRFIHATPPF